MIEVFPCSTPVLITLGNNHGIITGISIRFANVSYEVTYYYDGEYKMNFFNEKEFTASGEKQKIGFKQQ